MEICFCCRSSMSLLSPDGTREKGRSEWASIVLCSRQFTHTHLPNHTHSLLLYNEINALSFPLCAQHLTVPKASCDQTPHHVLKLLILMLTQCSFCTLVWLFIRIVLMPFLMGVFIRFSFLNGYSLSYNGFVLLLFCVSDHTLAGTESLYLALALLVKIKSNCKFMFYNWKWFCHKKCFNQS